MFSPNHTTCMLSLLAGGSEISAGVTRDWKGSQRKTRKDKFLTESRGNTEREHLHATVLQAAWDPVVFQMEDTRQPVQHAQTQPYIATLTHLHLYKELRWPKVTQAVHLRHASALLTHIFICPFLFLCVYLQRLSTWKSRGSPLPHSLFLLISK